MSVSNCSTVTMTDVSDEDISNTFPQIHSATPVAYLEILENSKYKIGKKRFPIYTGKNLIGRDKKSDICLPIPSVSRTHASIEIEKKHHFIIDYRSHNKTRKSRFYIRPETYYELLNESLVKIGPLKCQYFIEDETKLMESATNNFHKQFSDNYSLSINGKSQNSEIDLETNHSPIAYSDLQKQTESIPDTFVRSILDCQDTQLNDDLATDVNHKGYISPSPIKSKKRVSILADNSAVIDECHKYPIISTCSDMILETPNGVSQKDFCSTPNPLNSKISRTRINGKILGVSARKLYNTSNQHALMSNTMNLSDMDVALDTQLELPQISAEHKRKSSFKNGLKKFPILESVESVESLKSVDNTTPSEKPSDLDSKSELDHKTTESKKKIRSNKNSKKSNSPLNEVKQAKISKSKKKSKDSNKSDDTGSSLSFNNSSSHIVHRIIFSGTEELAWQKTIKSLGGVITDDPSIATVLVIEQVKRTLKLMHCLSRGISVVSVNWLHKSAQAASFLEPVEFEIKELSSALRSCRTLKKPLLKGWDLFFTGKVRPDIAQLSEISKIIGVNLHSDFSKIQETHKSSENLVVITCKDDLDYGAKGKNDLSNLFDICIDLKIPVLFVEFLLSTLMEQNIVDMELHKSNLNTAPILKTKVVTSASEVNSLKRTHKSTTEEKEKPKQTKRRK